jgi:hypothetical protein
MPSKYKNKQAKPITKQMPALKELSLMVQSVKKAVCTNCGRATICHRYSKCSCGGTYQTLKDRNNVSKI